ncbi:MAG: MerR family DNA-binding protein [Nitrospiraceae bacterium]|nr:MAG: MerR family DNA-binding protein [Nitrospiraceae bacterium]
MKSLTSGQLAQHAEVHVETICYYERRGLLERPPRTDAGYRLYPKEAILRIRFIRHAQELGFSLQEIGELLRLRYDGKTPCSEVKKRADKKIQDIKKKLVLLRRMKKALMNLAKDCSGHGPVSECPILEALER